MIGLEQDPGMGQLAGRRNPGTNLGPQVGTLGIG